jgi:hypothetical protein
MQRALTAKPQGTIDGRTPDQRFFISFAQFWRAKMTPEVERLLVQTDTHSPARFRVQGAVPPGRTTAVVSRDVPVVSCAGRARVCRRHVDAGRNLQD